MVPVPPFATASVPLMVESVVDATHVGLPFASARMNPSVDDATRANDVAVSA